MFRVSLFSLPSVFILFLVIKLIPQHFFQVVMHRLTVNTFLKSFSVQVQAVSSDLLLIFKVPNINLNDSLIKAVRIFSLNLFMSLNFIRVTPLLCFHQVRYPIHIYLLLFFKHSIQFYYL